MGILGIEVLQRLPLAMLGRLHGTVSVGFDTLELRRRRNVLGGISHSLGLVPVPPYFLLHRKLLLRAISESPGLDELLVRSIWSPLGLLPDLHLLELIRALA